MSASNQKMFLTRNNSICPTPETALLESVKRNDTETITTLINSNNLLLEHEYSETTKTILPTACSEDGIRPTTVQTLIDLGADIAGTLEWKPLHLAAENPNSLILEVVIANLKPGQINDTVDGNTALHSIVKGEDAEELARNVELLLNAGINVNAGDGKNVSAILWAAKHGLKKIVATILDKSVLHVDLDSHNLRGKTARQLIKEKRLYEAPLPEKVQHQFPKDWLFSLLKQEKEDKFVGYFDTLALTNPRDFVNVDDNTSTLLQYACEKGLIKIVKYLVDKAANVNLVTKNHDRTPVELAAENGYFEIFDVLVKQREAVVDVNILCYLLKKLDNPKFDKINHEECCNILLQAMDDNKSLVDVNGEDGLTNTPIHYSLRYADQATTEKLLKLGASLACKNNFGIMPVQDIQPETLERHLDDCINFDIKNKNDEKRDFEVTFEYRSLMPPAKTRKFADLEDCAKEELLPETEVVNYMSRAPEFKSLLKHPVIVSFLLMKWQRIRWLFWTNLIFYICFVLSLVVYIFTYYATNCEESSNFCLALGKISWITTNLTFWILVARELFQITVSPTNYLQDFDNFVDFVLILITGMILYISAPSDDTRKQLSSIAILLAAFELVLMVGQHPKLSTNVVMLKTVSVNFFKLLLWYSLLIIAFALSFYILFDQSEVSPNGNATDADGNEDSFRGPGKSLFKTIVMLTGEFDAGSINFHTYPVTSKLIFSFFVFMITIILLNLLNGLAVSDTQTIKNDAELVGHITRAQKVYKVESLLLGNVLPTSLIKLFRNLFCCCPCDPELTYTFFKPLARRVCLFTNVECCQLCVLPNNNGNIFYYNDSIPKKRKNSLSACVRSCSDTYLDKETVKRINVVVKRKKGGLEENAGADVEGLFTEIAALKAKLDEILSTLSMSKIEYQ